MLISPCTILALFAVSFAAGNDPFESFLAEFAAKRDGVQNLKASFSQTTVTQDETLVSTGNIVYVRPRRLAFRYDDPELTYLLDGLLAYEYDAELLQLQIYHLEDRPENAVFFLGFEEDASRLREAYRVELLRPRDDSPGGRALEIRPKEDDAQDAYFRRVTIQLRAGDYLPTEIHIENEDGSNVLIHISDFVVNGDLAESDAYLFVPEGTTVIEDDRYVETVESGGKRFPTGENATAGAKAEVSSGSPVQKSDLP